METKLVGYAKTKYHLNERGDAIINVSKEQGNR